MHTTLLLRPERLYLRERIPLSTAATTSDIRHTFGDLRTGSAASSGSTNMCRATNGDPKVPHDENDNHTIDSAASSTTATDIRSVRSGASQGELPPGTAAVRSPTTTADSSAEATVPSGESHEVVDERRRNEIF